MGTSAPTARLRVLGAVMEKVFRNQTKGKPRGQHLAALGGRDDLA